MNKDFDKKGDYFKSRMAQIGATEENIKLCIENPMAESPMPGKYEIDIFTDVKEGIAISFYSIEGELITYFNNNKTPLPRFYNQIRLKDPLGDFKYKLPRGEGTFPFFPPNLVRKFLAGEKIITLYLTEGAFKAFSGSVKIGIDIVGLTSITHYRDSTGQLHRDIQRLIEVCQVENVVILWDGDCLEISENALVRREELTKRPLGFYKAAKNIAKLVSEIQFDKTRESPDVLFCHVKSDSFDERPKGLDDLLIAAESSDKMEEVKRDILKIDGSGPFFFYMNISRTTSRLFKYFGLGDVETFYNFHIDLIKEQEFYFFGDLAYWNEAREAVEVIAPKWAREVRWIGDDFYVERLEPGAVMDRRRLLPRTKVTLALQYGKNFYRHLKYFDGFCNIPSHVNYEQVVEREEKAFYNLYFPFKWKSKAGECDTIINFIKHIFGTHKLTHSETGGAFENFELGLDYLQILLTAPMVALPVLCLYSAENATGKSTFGKLLARLFEDNCIFLSNSDLQSDFNEPYSNKLLAICEETLLERKKDVERIKALSTNNQITVNPKGTRQFNINFFCKFQFYSNNKRMIYITKHDERFWLLQVPKPDQEIPGLLDKMISEIPAFIAFLRDRKLATENESRMHFHPSLLRTPIFYQTVEVNEPAAATDLRNGIRDMFIDQKELLEIQMPLKNIVGEFLNGKPGTSWVQEILRDHIEVDLLRDENGVAKHKRGSYKKYEYDVVTEDIKSRTVAWRGRPYVFHREDFVKDQVAYDDTDDSPEPEDNFTPDQTLGELEDYPKPAEADDLPF